ncbi:MAG TPA: dehydratase [Dehalococcoidia bacterium]|nr:dehydratase [Dehalococcoidia bacterium]
MAKQLYYEDVEVGMEVPTLEKKTSSRQLVMWAGASEDYNEIHYDKDFALGRGLPGVIIHGRLKAAFLGQLMTDWIGERGKLKKLSASYRKMDAPGDTLVCKGKVTKKYIQDGEHCLECDIWIENAQGEKTTLGSAVVALPSRG